MIAKSYRLLVASVPPQFSGLLTSQTEGESHVQQEEISALLKEIGYTNNATRTEGFYSRYFLVPKKGGNRSAYPIQVSQETFFMLPVMLGAPAQLVYDRAEGCMFSCPSLSSTQEILEVCISRCGI